MRKQLITICLLMLSVSSIYAQDVHSHIGLTYGFSEAVLRERQSKNDEKLSYVTRYDGTKVGLVYQLDIIRGFGFQLGLNYQFGASLGKWQENNAIALQSKQKEKTNITLHMIDIPLEIQYSIPIAKQTYIIVYTGPAVQLNFAMSSKTFTRQYELNPNTKTWDWGKVQTLTNNTHFTTDVDDDKILDYRHGNVTWGVGLGFQYQRYYIRGGYDFGILSPYKDPFNNRYDFMNRGRFDNWSIKLGIFLWEN